MSDIMVAFDLVGTLVKKEIFIDARKNLRLDLDCNFGWKNAHMQAQFDSRFDYGAVFQNWLDDQKQTISNALFNQFAKFLIEHATSGNYLYPDVPITLTSLVMQNVKLGFVTDGAQKVEGAMIQKIISLYGRSNDPNPIIVTGEMTGFLKKGGEPFRKLIELAGGAGVNEDHIIFVGDTPSADIEGTSDTHIRAVLINRDDQLISLSTMQPWHTIKDLIGVVNLIPQISNS